MKTNLSFLSKYKNRKILITPLNWGLGHATRCIPIIKKLAINNNVIVGSDGLALVWLQKALDDITIIELPSYQPQYKVGPMWLNMVRESPHLIQAIRLDHKRTQEIIQTHHIDLIISDHRLGVRSNQVESILVAHQLRIPHRNPIVSWLSTKAQLRMINKYSELWVPDHQQNRLSGYLSRISLMCPKRFIGPLSRFVPNDNFNNKYDIAVILSGPEPARTNLEEKLMEILNGYLDLKVVLIRGTPRSSPYTILSPSHHIEVQHLIGTNKLLEIISTSSIIISRSGYSTIMDLHALGKKAILIPTPNQPEQEYLASYHDRGDQYLELSQARLNADSLRRAIILLQRSSK